LFDRSAPRGFPWWDLGYSPREAGGWRNHIYDHLMQTLYFLSLYEFTRLSEEIKKYLF
jgi:hypothetical protein